MLYSIQSRMFLFGISDLNQFFKKGNICFACAWLLTKKRRFFNVFNSPTQPHYLRSLAYWIYSSHGIGKNTKSAVLIKQNCLMISGCQSQLQSCITFRKYILFFIRLYHLDELIITISTAFFRCILDLLVTDY